MDVRLAGMNIDADLLAEIRAALRAVAALPAGLSADADAARQEAGRLAGADNWTPETLSAAYARISRDPRPVTELRAIARAEVDAARRSNESIIFGLGHASVAEHAVFNLDILGLSRLAVEEVQRMRLASYTEKSQRYILLEEDFVLPEEIESAGQGAAFRDLVRGQSAFYRDAYERLRPWVFETNAELAASKKNHRMLEGLAKEDARYGLSLATTVQLGATLNARSVESLIARTSAHPLAELRDFSRRLYAAVAGLAPSVIKYTEASRYERETAPRLREIACEAGGAAVDAGAEPAVRLLDMPEDAEEITVAAILHTHGRRDAAACRAEARGIGRDGRLAVVRAALESLGPHDAVVREFEHVLLRYEVVVSAACFGQLKRHRMSTVTSQAYEPGLGITVPPSFAPTGLVEGLEALREQAEELYRRLGAEGEATAAAPYVLLNAHRRRVLWSMNARELYHVARLRCDAHAQWDIRRIADAIVALARERSPGLLLLACGKDRFEETRREVFGRAIEA